MSSIWLTGLSGAGKTTLGIPFINIGKNNKNPLVMI
jgi:adenylylsulfate kinase-like enzyme